MYKYILFDLDGTLTDSADGIVNSVTYALDKMGIDKYEKNELLKFIGPPLDYSFKVYFNMSDSDAAAAIVYYREYFRYKGIFENKVYPGVENMLSTLKRHGKTIVLATSKPEIFAKQILEHFSLSEYFDIVVGASLDGSLSEKADIIKSAMTKILLANRNEFLMIGDRYHDIIGANENGISALGVLYGYGDGDELNSAGAYMLANDTTDILRLIINENY